MDNHNKSLEYINSLLNPFTNINLCKIFHYISSNKHHPSDYQLIAEYIINQTKSVFETQNYFLFRDQLSGYAILLLCLFLHPSISNQQKQQILNLILQHNLFFVENYWTDIGNNIALVIHSKIPNPTELNHLQCSFLPLNQVDHTNFVLTETVLSSKYIIPFLNQVLEHLPVNQLVVCLSENKYLTREDIFTIYNNRCRMKNLYTISWFLIKKIPIINLKIDLFYQSPTLNNALLLLTDPNLPDVVIVDIYNMYSDIINIETSVFNHPNCPDTLKLKNIVK